MTCRRPALPETGLALGDGVGDAGAVRCLEQVTATLVGGLLLAGAGLYGGCAHAPDPGPPRIIKWSDTALGAKAARSRAEQAAIAEAAKKGAKADAEGGAPAETEGDSSDDPNVVPQLIQEQGAEAIAACYEKELKKNNKLQGAATLVFTVNSKGETKDVVTRGSTMPNKAVESCIVEEVKAWQFPYSGPETVYTFPFAFKPTGISLAGDLGIDVKGKGKGKSGKK